MGNSLQTNETLHDLRQLADPAEQHRLQSDQELLELYLAAGDRCALEALIERYTPLVSSVCSLTVADRNCAEDAFQATFLILIGSANKIRRQASLAAWLHGVAYRCACRLRKKRSEQSLDESGEAMTAAEEKSVDPLVELARRMNLEALDRELEELPEALRAPLVEHYLLGNTAAQIAERMELSVSAIEGRLRRGRHALRGRLARRGVSLSVLVVGAGLFQEHLAASEGGQWAANFFQTHLPADCSLSNVGRSSSVSNPQVSSLIRGETSMFATSSLKAVVAAGAVGLLLTTGSLIALRVVAADPATSSGRGSTAVLNMPTMNMLPQPAEPNVLAQFGGADDTSGQSGGDGDAIQANDDGVAQSSSGQAPASDPFGMPIAGAIAWQRPEATGGNEPSWLVGGRTAMEAMEKNRAGMSQQIEFDFNATPLREVIAWLSEQTNMSFELNAEEIELEEVASVDAPITITGKGSVREFIRRIGDALELTYVIHESTVEITTRVDAATKPNSRFYDLSFVLPNSTNAPALVLAIETTVRPKVWIDDEASIAIVGSMMIVSADDSVHQEIEIMLDQLAKMNPANASQSSPATGFPGMGMGGMGGGMGGMF